MREDQLENGYCTFRTSSVVNFPKNIDPLLATCAYLYLFLRTGRDEAQRWSQGMIPRVAIQWQEINQNHLDLFYQAFSIHQWGEIILMMLITLSPNSFFTIGNRVKKAHNKNHFQFSKHMNPPMMPNSGTDSQGDLLPVKSKLWCIQNPKVNGIPNFLRPAAYIFSVVFAFLLLEFERLVLLFQWQWFDLLQQQIGKHHLNLSFWTHNLKANSGGVALIHDESCLGTSMHNYSTSIPRLLDRRGIREVNAFTDATKNHILLTSNSEYL